MPQLLIELVLAPSLAGLATLAGRRWGARLGGIVSAFPAIVGPVLLIDAIGHGGAFTVRAANGTLLGLASLSAFALAYGLGAKRWRWPQSLFAGWAAAASTATAVGLLAGQAGQPAGLVVAVLTLGIGYLAMPRSDPAETTVRTVPIPARMALTAALVTSLPLAAGMLGPAFGGMLAALPVLASVLAVATHIESGGGAAIAVLRGMLTGMTAFVAFCQVLIMVMPGHGIAAAFLAATAAALVAQAACAAADRTSGADTIKRSPLPLQDKV